MSRRRSCVNFAWREEDPAWMAERENDRKVFRKLRSMIRGGRSADKAIAALFKDEAWRARMRCKKPASWKRCFYRRVAHAP